MIIGWDERAWHPQGIKEVVRLLNQLDKKLAPYNIKTGFHNHEHSFDDFQGTTVSVRQSHLAFNIPWYYRINVWFRFAQFIQTF